MAVLIYNSINKYQAKEKTELIYACGLTRNDKNKMRKITINIL